MLKTTLSLALLLGASTAAYAQENLAPNYNVAEPAVSDPSIKPTAPTVPVITDDEHLYETFGGREGLTALMDDAMARWLQNPKTRPFFEAADQTKIKALLVEQFCVIMHGPCTYSGRTMAEAHRGMNVKEGNFYGLVEELQVAMNKRHIPFRAQNRLIAALAPMHRDIIDK
ncbi:group 1 truncated hemoglobin [Novosphingobium sp. NDB2Meth1]|uniref:group I truncated hemoglobin n=1 Tax=Novosphingobium sp. NDB2Meth1 TaxID=1892847 RepID=UPI000931FB6C|nr:group 1 truncated hemoglobin [Novosphingobium sp. NDB2Meth1]